MKLAEIKSKLEAITNDKSASETLPCLVPHIEKRMRSGKYNLIGLN